MSLIPTFYNFADAGAPSSTGQTGSLIALLRAVLVTGYGTGENYKPGAGWTEPFAAAGNVAVFRNSVLYGSGSYLRVDDSGLGGAGARAAEVKSYRSMTDLNTGVDVSPNPALTTGGLQWVKSWTLDGISRPWYVAANERAAYIFLGEKYSAGYEKGYYAGDLISNKPSDGYPFSIAGIQGYSSSEIPAASSCFSRLDVREISQAPSRNSMWVTRQSSYAIGAARLAFLDEVQKNDGWPFGANALPAYPDPVSGGVNLGRLSLLDAAYQVRGRLPGLWVPYNIRPFMDRELVAGLPGMNNLIAKQYALAYESESSAGRLLFDHGVPWE